MGITGMQSGVARGMRRWIINPVYAASEPGLGNRVDSAFWAYALDRNEGLD